MNNRPRVPHRHELPDLTDDQYHEMLESIVDMFSEGLTALRQQRDKAELENTLLKTALVKTLAEEDSIHCYIDLSDVPAAHERVTMQLIDQRVYFTITEPNHANH